MRTTLFIALIIIFSTPRLLFGHLAEAWTYQEMFEKADFVVIAKVVSTKDTKEHATLKDLKPPTPVVGVITEMESRLILKGPKAASKFQLHHYRFQSEKDEFAFANGPQLVKIAEGRHPTYLLFLTKERNGLYAPVTDQTDPAVFSVLELKGGAN